MNANDTLGLPYVFPECEGNGHLKIQTKINAIFFRNFQIHYRSQNTTMDIGNKKLSGNFL